MLRVNTRLIKQTISNLKNQGRIFSNKKEKIHIQIRPEPAKGEGQT